MDINVRKFLHLTLHSFCDILLYNSSYRQEIIFDKFTSSKVLGKHFRGRKHFYI